MDLEGADAAASAPFVVSGCRGGGPRRRELAAGAGGGAADGAAAGAACNAGTFGDAARVAASIVGVSPGSSCIPENDGWANGCGADEPTVPGERTDAARVRLPSGFVSANIVFR
jgi:hypothetical protein